MEIALENSLLSTRNLQKYSFCLWILINNLKQYKKAKNLPLFLSINLKTQKNSKQIRNNEKTFKFLK